MRSARVTFKNSFAGTLDERPDGGTRFTYADGWTTPIAAALPVSLRVHDWSPGLHPVFQHLSPEGWLRERQARADGLAPEDDFGLLLAFGADCIGAIGVTGDHGSPPTSDPAARGRRTLSGVQPKLLCVRDGDVVRPAAATGPALLIAKFNTEAVPDLVRNERLSLALAADVLGAREVARFSLAVVAEEERAALVVERFDRTADGTKLRAEDFAQILNRPRGADFRGKYDGDHEEVAEGIRALSARPVIDVARFYARTVLNVALGNCDAHLKNWTMLETADGLRLSPAYDIVNTRVYGRYDEMLALRFKGRDIAVDAADRMLMLAFAAAIGMPMAAAARAIDTTVRRLLSSSRLLPPDGEPADGFVHRYRAIVEGACHRLTG